jgi:cytochrome oxidase Cu insertion factor (SCO1/SenC/PrrC family)
MTIRARYPVALAAALALLLSLPAPAPASADKVLDDLMFELQLVPLDGQAPAPFELEQLADGAKVTLAGLRGRPVLLYFWATW